MAVSIIAAAVAAAAGIYSIVKGETNAAKARRMARENKRPNYEIPDEEYDMQKLLQSRAAQGFSDSSYQAARGNLDRGLTSTLDTILKGGGDPNSASKAMDGYNQGLINLQVADEGMKLKNLQLLIAQNQRMSDMKDKQWQVNKFGPYADKAAAASQLAGVAAQQTASGVSTVASAAGGLASSYGQKKQIGDVTNGTGGTGGGGAGAQLRMTGGDTNYYKDRKDGWTPDNDTWHAPMSYDGNNGYDPSVQSMVYGFDWSKVKPQNRNTYLSLWNKTYGNGYGQ